MNQEQKVHDNEFKRNEGYGGSNILVISCISAEHLLSETKNLKNVLKYTLKYFKNHNPNKNHY